MGLFNFLTQEIAIDLGTANTLIIHNDQVVVDEPSIVATAMFFEKYWQKCEKIMLILIKTGKIFPFLQR